MQMKMTARVKAIENDLFVIRTFPCLSDEFAVFVFCYFCAYCMRVDGIIALMP